MEIRALNEGDDRSQFRSGDLELDRFFQRFAGQNQFKHYVGVTYVAVEDGRILGFATVAPGHVEIDDLPAAVRKKLPRYPLPMLRLARLAVDETQRGQGLGAQLLGFVLQLAVRMASDFGCVGVVVDAKPDAVSFYRKYGFLSLDLAEGQSDARPSPIPMFLATRAIRIAFEGEGT
jgi:GNAT superfamily N-acetyltransferase